MLGTLPVEQTDRILAMLPALSAWVLQAPATTAAGPQSESIAREQRVRAVAALLPVFHLTACQQVTGANAFQAEKWRAALQQSEAAAAVAAAVHLLCRKLVSGPAHHSSQRGSTVWRDAADSHMQQACEVLAVCVASGPEANAPTMQLLQSLVQDGAVELGSEQRSAKRCTAPVVAAQGACALAAALAQQCDARAADVQPAVELVLAIGQALAACVSATSAAANPDAAKVVLECLRFAVARQLAIGPDGATGARELLAMEPLWWPVGPASQLVLSDAEDVSDADRDRALEGTLRLCGSAAQVCGQQCDRGDAICKGSWLKQSSSDDALSRVLQRLNSSPESLPIACMLADMAGCNA